MKIDHQAFFKPITKWTTRMRADQVDDTFCRAVQVAMSEVPGPVHIGLPSDLGNQPAGAASTGPLPLGEPPSPDPAVLDRMEELFREARKPVLAVGLTAVRAGVQELVLKIAEVHRVPVVLTPMAKGIMPEDHLSYAVRGHSI